MKLYVDGHAVKREDGRIFAVVGSPEDAEFVRKACNSHEQLVEALKAMLSTQQNANDGIVGGNQVVTQEDVEACRLARAALEACK